MKHPIAGVVGDEGDLGASVRIEQNRIGPMRVGEDTEHMTMEVNRVMPCRVVHEFEHIGCAALQVQQYLLMSVLGHRPPVHRPEEPLVLALTGYRAHRAAAEDDAMP